MLGKVEKFKLLPKLLPYRQSIQRCDVGALECHNINVLNTLNDQKRFVKARKKKKLKPLKENFFNCLFSGLWEKNIFQYPTTLSTSSIDNVILHSKEVNEFLKLSDSSQKFSATISDLKKLELFGLSVPQKYGGIEYSTTEILYLLENLNCKPQLGHFLGCHENFCCQIINSLGNQNQKIRYLPRLTTGEYFGCLAYLENFLLRDLNCMQTSLVFDKNSGTFILNGRKNWVYNANMADIIIVLCKVLNNDKRKDLQNWYNFCIVDRKAPGVKIQDLNNVESDSDFYLHQVEFENVIVPEDNIIGNMDVNIFPTLKKALSLNYLSASVACLSLLKSLFHSATLHYTKNMLSCPSLKEYSFIQEDLRHLSMYSYVTESLVYLVGGRFDEFEEPDLFLEACATKSLALELLSAGLTTYCKIVGHEVIKLPSLLHKTSNVLQHYSAIDQNQAHLKLVIGSAGLEYVAKSDKSLREKVKIVRKPYNYPFEYLNHIIFSQNKRITNLKDEVNVNLKNEAEILGKCLSIMNLCVEKQFFHFGSNANKEDGLVIKLGQMAAYIFALSASISRACALCNHEKNYECEVNFTKTFAIYTQSIVSHLSDEIIYQIGIHKEYKYIGQASFNKQQYPLCHPLFRSF